MTDDYLDRWAKSVQYQMVEKGHGFSVSDTEHTVGLLVLVASEIFEAIHVVKKRYLDDIPGIREELADALIRMGHFAATADITLSDALPFASFDDLGQSRVEMFGAFQNGQWAMIARLGRLANQACDVAEAWEGKPSYMMERAFCSLFASISGAAVALGGSLDQTIADKTAVNGKRPYRFGVAHAA